MRNPARSLLAILFAIALLGPGAAHAKKPSRDGWAEFMSRAMAYLSRQQAASKREFALESWKRYDVDPGTGTFTFSTNGKPGVVAHAVLVGTIAGRPRTWLWSWADSSVPESLNGPMVRVLKFGKDHGFKKLTDAGWPGDETDGWSMAAAAAWILSAKGAYRAPYGDGALFFVFTDIHRAN